jgi:hypothetical protein
MPLVEVAAEQRTADTASHCAKRASTQRVARESTAGAASDGSNRAIPTAAAMPVMTASAVIGSIIPMMASRCWSRGDDRPRNERDHGGYS